MGTGSGWPPYGGAKQSENQPRVIGVNVVEMIAQTQAVAERVGHAASRYWGRGEGNDGTLIQDMAGRGRFLSRK